MEGMLNPFGATGEPAPVQAQGVPLPQTTAPAAPAPSGAVSPEHAEEVFGQPLPPAYAATEADIQRALESGDTTPAQTTPAGFLSTAIPATPAGQTPPASTGTTDPSFWESDANPYKRQAQANRPDPVREIDTYLTQHLDRDAEVAFSQLVAGGMPQDQARAYVNQATALTRANMETQRIQHLAGPAVRAQVAADIAQKHSLPNAPINPKDLEQYRTPAEMIAAAKTMQTVRRTTNFQTRAQTRVDGVESSGGVASGAATASRNLNAFETIRQGVRSNNRR